MILIRCQCGSKQDVAKSALGKAVPCPECGGVLRPVAPGRLPGDADFFHARLVITAGPERAGEQVLLGGNGPIEIGKQPERAVFLAGELVSRLHARLNRAGAGWQIEDRQSTNGLFINGKRIERAELHDGDQLRIGEYQLVYASDSARPASLWQRWFSRGEGSK
jgi:hypothetical protein